MFASIRKSLTRAQQFATLLIVNSGKTYLATPEINRYVYNVSVQENPVLVKCREETQALPNAVMQISPEQGQLFRVLLALWARKRHSKSAFHRLQLHSDCAGATPRWKNRRL